MLKNVFAVNKDTVVVLENGSSIESPWLKDNAPAILEAWYPGEQGGRAIANTIFGDNNPSGKLPMTFVKTWNDLPAQGDYDLSKGRTYLYFEKEPLFAFGHGLSYTHFSFKEMKLNKTKFHSDEIIKLSVSVQNTGNRSGEEIVQVYVKDLFDREEKPLQRLKAFQRVMVSKDQTKQVTLEIPVKDLAFWDTHQKEWKVGKGKYQIKVGNASDAIFLSEEIEVSDQ